MTDELFEAGLKNRKEVLGAEHVNNSLASADEFTQPLQELVTKFAWGAVWGRDEELPRKTRSIINLAMLSALNRPHELKLHVRGALNNGVSKEEMREIFLQVAIYCGFPASIDAFRTAKQVFEEMEQE
ncbi:MAG: 4-carboxymuconolactone decarboxylase [Rhodospirillaceae bacterium]|jgi:4-carboxymuconolactone decarboxylase|nr:4-carboxymuconolactone decarboxylase [Rhodospirillaceae bacterium]MBT6138254.1 4-carboxymuconolactone decarboxylase [Rhodospirillaceae bacterium]